MDHLWVRMVSVAGGVDSVHHKFCWSCTAPPVGEGFWFQFLFVGTRTQWRRSDKFKVLKK